MGARMRRERAERRSRTASRFPALAVRRAVACLCAGTLGRGAHTAVTGTVDFLFDDGTGFQHAIDATVCPLSVDLCQRFEPCFDYACVPAAG